jgi:hypothetical protein
MATGRVVPAAIASGVCRSEREIRCGERRQQ